MLAHIDEVVLFISVVLHISEPKLGTSQNRAREMGSAWLLRNEKAHSRSKVRFFKQKFQLTKQFDTMIC